MQLVTTELATTSNIRIDRVAFLQCKNMVVFGELGKLDQLLDTSQDTIGLTLMDEKLPQRVRKPRKTPESGAF